jgi:cytoskeletal protein RodZ
MDRVIGRSGEQTDHATSGSGNLENASKRITRSPDLRITALFDIGGFMKLRTLILVGVLAIALVMLACTVPAWVNTVESDAEVAAPIAASLIDVIDPALAPVVTLIENGFNALVKTLDTYKASPTATHLQAVQAAFAAVNTNVAQLESAAQIKNATTATRVTAVVQLLAQAVTEIAALVPASAGLKVRGSALGKEDSEFRIPNSGSRIPKGWKAKDLKREFNKIVKGDPRFKELK